jgi:hypothetical protein
VIDLLLVVLAAGGIWLIHQLAVNHYKNGKSCTAENAKAHLKEVGIHEYLLNKTGSSGSTKQIYIVLLLSVFLCLLSLLFRLISSVI